MTDFAHVWTALPAWAWLLTALAAFLIGFSKTAIANVALVSVVVLAALLPVKESTGVVLVMYLAADLVAIWVYRQHVDWKLIGSLIAPVLLGIAVGAVFLDRADDLVLKRVIGAVVLGLLVLGFWREKLRAERRAVGFGYGSLAGFTTMVANAGGPAFSLYLLASRFDKLRFLGTSAWFYFGINLTKLPISIGLGIVHLPTALFALAFAPVILAGTFVGVRLIRRMNQKTFESVVVAFVAVAAAYLLLG
ncbi:MAG: sulfite exporter TauE/SafE family protein [Bifidobacteriaceae bacterium]|nr:sulfite exporter TauE/SafE family protein [Bifidobacteriaceae bacterium]